MMRVKHWRSAPSKNNSTTKEWQDAWLLSFIHSAHKGVVAIISYQDDGWGHAQGMKITSEEDLSNLRLSRTRIPLFAPSEAVAPPDAA